MPAPRPFGSIPRLANPHSLLPRGPFADVLAVSSSPFMFTLITHGLAPAIFIDVLASTLFTAPAHPLYIPSQVAAPTTFFSSPRRPSASSMSTAAFPAFASA